MLGDLLTSVAVLLNGLVLMFQPWYWLDPVLSMVIALFIFKNCWSILREATLILMDATPNSLDIHQVREYLEKIPGILGVHYLHAWNLSSSSVAFSCHVVVPDQQLSKVDLLSETVRCKLLDRFGIDHPILQFETAPCGTDSILCELSCTSSGGAAASPAKQSPSSCIGWVKRQPLSFWVRLFLGGIFIFASIDKILHPQAFAQLTHNYQIFPAMVINLIAIIIPWVELVLGLLLVFHLWLPGAVLLANVLLVSFFATLVFNVARGLNVHCGCFTTSTEGDPTTTWYLIRDSFFLLAGGYLFYKELIAGSPAPKSARALPVNPLGQAEDDCLAEGTESK